MKLGGSKLNDKNQVVNTSMIVSRKAIFYIRIINFTQFDDISDFYSLPSYFK